MEALPQEYQDILWEEEKWHSDEFIRQQPIADQESIDDMIAGGVEAIDPDAATMEKVRANVLPIWEEWAAQGPLEKEAYDLALKALGLS